MVSHQERFSEGDELDGLHYFVLVQLAGDGDSAPDPDWFDRILARPS
jgi:hypothetical protein